MLLWILLLVLCFLQKLKFRGATVMAGLNLNSSFFTPSSLLFPDISQFPHIISASSLGLLEFTLSNISLGQKKKKKKKS